MPNVQYSSYLFNLCRDPHRICVQSFSDFSAYSASIFPVSVPFRLSTFHKSATSTLVSAVRITHVLCPIVYPVKDRSQHRIKSHGVVIMLQHLPANVAGSSPTVKLSCRMEGRALIQPNGLGAHHCICFVKPEEAEGDSNNRCKVP